MRAGRYVKQPNQYTAFIPAPLPPLPAVTVDSEMINLLSEADRALGRLDGIASVLPNPDMFVAMYVREEAVLSSQIEGTQSTLDDVLRFEMNEKGQEQPKDVTEVVNYVRAMNYGLARLKKLPLSLRLIREIHAELMRGVRGGNRTPGEFRHSQNWIGGSSPSNAVFVPPPISEMQEALNNLEKFMHAPAGYPVLIHCGLIHCQFETIHPFLDGNGRVGRLLITFLLCHGGILQRPLLYLSLFLKGHRQEYYDRLMAVRNDGKWEDWLKFFLRGVLEVSTLATEKARAILRLRAAHGQLIRTRIKGNAVGLHLLDYLYEQPMVTVRMVAEKLDCTFNTASKLMLQFEKLGLLPVAEAARRNRRYRYEPYLALFEQDKTSKQKRKPPAAARARSIKKKK